MRGVLVGAARRAAEKDAILAAIPRPGAAPPPRVVEISWQDRCNIDCFFCSTSEIRAGNFELSGERLEALFDEMQAMGVKGVRLMGGGEPLFRKDAAALIRAIGDRGLRITDVTTNGVLLTEPVIRALYETGCDEICVSLNAGDARSYGAMMQTTPKNFDRVVENVRRAAALKREIGAGTLVKVQFLVYKENFRQLPEMYRLFRETGADRFWLNGLYPVRPMPTMTDADVDEMLRLYEEVLAEDYFERLERFSFWEKSIAHRIDEVDAARLRARPARPPRAREAPPPLRRGGPEGALRRRAARVLPGRLVLDDAQRQRRRRDLLHPAGPPDRGPRQHPLVEPVRDLARRALRSGSGRSSRRSWPGAARSTDFSHSCAVESVCAEKGACPTRSYYWEGDAEFRRRFHEMVEAMPVPAGEPFATLPGRPAPRLPVHTGVFK